MSEVDPSIALGVRPVQFANPLELAGNAMQLRNLGIQGQNAQITLQQNQRALQDQKTIADLYRANTLPDGSVNHAGVIAGLGQAGLGDKIPAYQEQVGKASKETTAATAADLDLHQKRLQILNNSISSLLALPKNPDGSESLNHDAVTSTISSLVDQKVVDAQTGAQLARMVPGRPDQLRPWLTQQGLSTMDTEKQITARLATAPKYNEQDRGSVIDQGTVDPTTGIRTSTGTTIAKTMTPDEAAKVKLMQDRGTFTATSGDLLASLSAKGISLPAGMRSKEQQIATLNGLIRKYPNMSPDEIADNIGNGQINFGSDKKAATVAAGQEGKVSTAVNELSLFGDQALAASAKVPRVNFVPANVLMQMADSSISDPALLTLKLKLNALNNAYNVLSARGGTDAESRKHVQALFSAATGPEGVEALVKGLKEEGAGAKSAARDASHVGTAANAVPIKSDADYAALKSGTPFIAPDGSHRVKP